MTEAEIRRQVEAEIVAWLRGEHRLSCRFGPDFADAIEAGDYHYPDIPRMKLGPIGNG